jgi:integrase
MPVVRLGRRGLSNLPKVDRPTIFYDEMLKGFGLRVAPSGSKSWLIEYRPGHGGRGVAKRRMVIGSATALTPEKARESASRLLARVELGEDPAQVRAEARKGGSLSDLLDTYIDEHIGPKRKPHTKKTFESYFRVHVKPALGTRPANCITRADIAKLHRAIGDDHPATANRILVVLSAVFSYAVKAGLLPVDFNNPAQGIEKFRENARERYLSEEELMRLGETLRLAETDGLPWEPDPAKKAKHAPKPANRRVKYDEYVVAAIRLLVLTGCRLREILTLRWEEVDLQRGLLFLPDSKTGRKTVVLGAAAVMLLTELYRRGDYVIASSDPKKPRHDLNRPWKAVSRHAGLSDVRLHDLRHSFASVGASAQLSLPVIGKLLGHANPSTTQRYAHLGDGPLRRAADAISGTIAAALNRSAAPIDRTAA